MYLDTVCPDGNDFLSVEVTRGVADKIIYTLQTLKKNTGCELAPITTSLGRQLYHKEDPRRPQLAGVGSSTEQFILGKEPSIGLKTLDVSTISDAVLELFLTSNFFL